MPRLFLSLLAALTLAAAAPMAPANEAADSESRKAVLITGASTGLGRAMAELMASRGVFVYAGARKDSDIAELSAIENIQGIRLDVTVQEEIDAAVKTVTEAGRGLHGLINNAGVAVVYPLIETPEDEMQFQMDVNVFGPYRVTRAFAPLIIESKGRISTTSSIAGILSGPLFGPYSMSKHATEAFTDSLASEMAGFGVHVSVIEPGSYQSDIARNLADRLEARGFSTEDSLYKEQLDGMVKRLAEDGSDRGDPAEVAEAAWLAMFEENPKRRYMVVPNAGQANVTVRKAIEEAVQLNQRQKFSLSRDELVKMLDELMAANP